MNQGQQQAQQIQQQLQQGMNAPNSGAPAGGAAVPQQQQLNQSTQNGMGAQPVLTNPGLPPQLVGLMAANPALATSSALFPAAAMMAANPASYLAMQADHSFPGSNNGTSPATLMLPNMGVPSMTGTIAGMQGGGNMNTPNQTTGNMAPTPTPLAPMGGAMIGGGGGQTMVLPPIGPPSSAPNHSNKNHHKSSSVSVSTASAKQRGELSQAERAQQNRDRNREHARSTRLRKKAYVQKLKELVEGLHAERTEEVRQRRVAVQHLAEVQNVRRAVVRSFLRFLTVYETEERKWATIVEEDFWLKQPVTPFRSFRRAEIEKVCAAGEWCVGFVSVVVCDVLLTLVLSIDVVVVGVPHESWYRCDDQ